MSYTSTVADQLRPLLSGYRVRGYTDQLDGVDTPTVLVWLAGINRPAQLDPSRVTLDLRVQVVVGTIDPKTVDVTLDDALDGVLAAIAQAGAWLDWTRVERVIRSDSFHAYTIHCTTLATIGD